MTFVEPIFVGSGGALVGGLLLLAGGLYARRGNRLHTLQGAAVLAGFAAVMGVCVMAAGSYFLIRAA
jgi:hypothetical protein